MTPDARSSLPQRLRYRCANSSRSWGATAVLGSPQVKQVAWKPPTALP
ncbi:hypothetical protein [Nostoc sp.]